MKLQICIWIEEIVGPIGVKNCDGIEQFEPSHSMKLKYSRERWHFVSFLYIFQRVRWILMSAILRGEFVRFDNVVCQPGSRCRVNFSLKTRRQFPALSNSRKHFRPRDNSINSRRLAWCIRSRRAIRSNDFNPLRGNDRKRTRVWNIAVGSL